MITAVLPQRTDPIPAVIPQLLIPSPRYYRQLCPHYRGIRGNTEVPITVQLTSSKSNASSKTWTPLTDRFIDDHLVEMFPLFNQARLQLVDVTNLAAVHRDTILQLPLVVD